MIYIGIDPGVSGGIAALTDGGAVLEACKMPATDADLLDCLRDILMRRDVEGHPRAVIERVHSLPKQGHVGAFTFGRGYGGLCMALSALEVPYEEVTPAVWQKAMGCRTAGVKNVSKRRAQQIFPSWKITHAIADALLIAEFCRRLEVRP